MACRPSSSPRASTCMTCPAGRSRRWRRAALPSGRPQAEHEMGCGMICPWCMHCGAYDEDYFFDEDRYCGICARQMPRGRDGWLAAFAALTPAMLETVEFELNKIAWSKSGLKPEV